MASESESLRLEECLESLIDYRGKTPRKTGSGIPLITAKLVKGGYIQTPNEFIAESDFGSWMTRGLPEIGDIVLTTEAPLGEVGQIKVLPVALAQRIVTLRGKSGLLNNDYLLYLLQSEEMQSKLRDRSTGTTVVGIRQSELRKIEVRLPSPSEQRSIASALKVLDDRIDNLRQTNATLEAIAQALFKSWFVDFDPVRAKAEGREPEGMDAATAALFPSKFEDSELGPIPKGWGVDRFDREFDFTMGQSPPGSTYNTEHSGIPFFQGCTDFGEVFPAERVYCSQPVRFARAGDLLMSVRAPVGALNIASSDCSIGRGLCAIRHKSGSTGLTQQFVKACMSRIERAAGEGALFNSLSKQQLAGLPVMVADTAVTEAMTAHLDLLINQMIAAAQQAELLMKLRDTLLPRLISGKLRLPEVERETEAALA